MNAGKCAFSQKELKSERELSGANNVNANQVIKAYRFYEKNPYGLLLLLATSDEEQRFFEDIYHEITETGG